ncbi:MAG: hypothetical protein ACREEY_14250 [Brevundimonas sp.]
MGALGLVALGLALGGLFGLTGPLPLNRLDAQADGLLRTPAPRPADIRQSARLTEQLIARRPTDAAAWLRLAYIDRLQHARLSAQAQDEVLRSYELEPLGPELTRWRQTFLFNNWPALSPELRERSLSELSAVFPRHGWALRDIPDAVDDPQGRMAAFMAFSRLRAEANIDGTTRQRSKT